jgi:hypothetical protein
MKQYPALENFIGAYFHPDWKDDDDTYQAVVERFLRDN